MLHSFESPPATNIYKNAAGCDSVEVTNFNEVGTNVYVTNRGKGELTLYSKSNITASYQWYNFTNKQLIPGTVKDSIFYPANSGVYGIAATDTMGCISYSIPINYNCKPDTAVSNYNICDGDSTYFFNNWHRQQGKYTKTIFNVTGCDSVMIANVNLIQITKSVDRKKFTLSVQPGASSYQWYDAGNETAITGATAGTYTYDSTVTRSYKCLISNQSGCSAFTDVINITSCVAEDINQDVSICPGDSIFFGNSWFKNPGNFTGIYAAQSGCDSSATLNLTVGYINATLLVSNDTLTVTGNGTVQWMDCNSRTIINNETANVFIPATNGDYAAIITNGSCIDTTACKTIIATGSNRLTVNREQITVYPNPTKGNINIILTKPCDGCLMSITDVLGREVMHNVLNGKQSTFDISNLPSGIYIVRVSKATEIQTVKVVKE